MTGWALFLDYLIVIALSALFLPHYLAGALQVHALEHNPWDVDRRASCVIVLVALVRLVRRPSLYGLGIVVPALDLLTQLAARRARLRARLLAARAHAGHVARRRTRPGTTLAFALPLAMLAFTGLETVANLAEEARRPGVDLPRSVFGAIATVVTIYVAIAVVALSAFPGPNTELGTTWIRAPLARRRRRASATSCRTGSATSLRFYVGVTGALILLAAVTTSISGFSRLAYSLGEHGQLPRSFGRLQPARARLAARDRVAPRVISSAIVIATSFFTHDVQFLASLFSFGVLLAFTAAQLAVIKLRDRRARPAAALPRAVQRAHPRRRDPAAGDRRLDRSRSRSGSLALATHPGARYAGPAWLAVGLVVFVAVRRSHGEGLMERVTRRRRAARRDVPHFQQDPRADEARDHRRGDARDRGQARAASTAREVEALHVIRVPLEQALDATMLDEEERAEASLAEAKLLGAEHGVDGRRHDVRARAIGQAIVERAREIDADLIVLGSAPRWRRQSRFFSPTVDYVLRKAPCEVLIVAFPQRVLDEELARPDLAARAELRCAAVKAIVIGCGRVGSAVALELQRRRAGT